MHRRTVLTTLATAPMLLPALTASTTPNDDPIAFLTARIHDECNYVLPLLPGLNTAYAYALSVMNIVTGLVSAPRYGFLASLNAPPTSDPSDILAQHAGICGQAQLAYEALAQQVGLPCRRTYVWYPAEFPDYHGAGIPGHATNEVFYGTSWHWFDPTWGTFYREPPARADEVLSLIDVLELDEEEQSQARCAYDSLLWAQTVQYQGEASLRGTGYAFLTFAHLRVESPLGTVLYER